MRRVRLRRQYPIHLIHFPLVSLLSQVQERRSGCWLVGDRVGASQYSSGQQFQEGELLFGVEGRDLVVSVLAVVQPYLPDLGLAARQGVGEVVVDAEGLAEVPQFLVGFPPDEAVAAELEELVACLFLQEGGDDELLGAR